MMKIKKEAIISLIQSKFRNNQALFADEIGITREYLNRLINNDSIDIIDSPKLCNNFISYCINNNIDYDSFIILQ